MRYEIDKKNNVERLYGVGLEAYNCDVECNQCDNKDCKFRKESLIFQGQVCDIFFAITDIPSKFIKDKIKELLKSIHSNDFSIEGLASYMRLWVDSNIDAYNHNDTKELITRYFCNLGLLRAISENQMNLENQIDTSFRTRYELYCHNVIERYKYLYAIVNSFLKNRKYTEGFFKFLCYECLIVEDFNIFHAEHETEQQILHAAPHNYPLYNHISEEADYEIYLTKADLICTKAKSDYDNFIVKNNFNKNIETYQLDSIDAIFDVCLISINYALENGYIIKKCKNCGRLFIPFNRSDTLYCDRIAPQDNDKTCKEYGAVKTYQEHLKNNTCMKKYRQIYMQKQMLYKRNPDIEAYKDNFEQFKIHSKQWKSDVKKGLKSEMEFSEWLNTVKGMRE